MNVNITLANGAVATKARVDRTMVNYTTGEITVSYLLFASAELADSNDRLGEMSIVYSLSEFDGRLELLAVSETKVLEQLESEEE